MLADHETRILGPDGRPFQTNGHDRTADAVMQAKAASWAADTYFQGLMGISLPSITRARDPFSNHPWVFAAAMTAALVASHAPYAVFEETPEEIATRARLTAKSGRTFVPRRGHGRRASLRHMLRPTAKRMFSKAAEANLDHPLMDLFLRPNPYQNGQQFFAFLVVWLMVRGEVFVVKTDDDGNPTSDTPTRLWPFGPDLFEPVMSSQSFGEIIGWWFKLPEYMPRRAGLDRVLISSVDLIQLKIPNPANPVRGMSRLAAAAQSIQLDLAIRAGIKSLLENQSVPRGVLQTEQQLTPKQVQEFREIWEQHHKGESRRGGVGVLPFGFQYQAIAMSSQDMESLARQDMAREEILAVMTTPGSVLGKTDAANWSTALVWEAGYWEKTILPMLKLIEVGLDASLFFEEADTTFGMFDLRGVEALRAGVAEKIANAEKLCGDRLHVPPRVAYEVVGLEVPDYEGDDRALVGGMLSPIDQILDPPEPDPMPAVPPPPVPAPAAEGDPKTEGDPETADPQADPAPEGGDGAKRRGPGLIFRDSKKTRLVKAANRWKQFLKLEVALEGKMRNRYRQWIRAERDRTIDRFDKVTGGKKNTIIDLSAVLPLDKSSGDALKALTRPLYAAGLDEVYHFTLDEIGIPTFAVDDDRLLDFFHRRETRFINSTPVTVRERLTKSLSLGIQADETIQQLRLRVAEVYEISGSSAKALTVARTETAGFLNGERDQMFLAQGIGMQSWFTAGDEHVRPSHQLFGEAGPKPIGFNWLELAGGGGKLVHPGDTDGPAGEVINCRCMALAES